MKLLLTGGSGHLGRALLARAAAQGHTLVAPPHAALDVVSADSVARALDDATPDAVINSAAFSQPDDAERDPTRAFAVNAGGAANVARACVARDIPLFHISTDYVFDGRLARPYRDDDPVAPVNQYGHSKAEGERAVRAEGGSVVRTSWLLTTFAERMLRLASERTVLQVVSDQVTCGTIPDDLAGALLRLAELGAPPATYHYCNDGPTTRYEMALAVFEAVRNVRKLRVERVEPVTLKQFGALAPRAPYSVLDTSRVRSLGIATPSWKGRITELSIASLPPLR
jgi:dTDP-4-dehydrorhamnose reductase